MGPEASHFLALLSPCCLGPRNNAVSFRVGVWRQVEVGAWRECTTVWMVGEGLVLAGQLKKQEGGPPALTQQAGAGDREDTANGLPPPLAPVRAFQTLSASVGPVASASRPLHGSAAAWGAVASLRGPSCLLGSPPNQPLLTSPSVMMGVSGCCHFRTSYPLGSPRWHGSPQWGQGFMVALAAKPNPGRVGLCPLVGHPWATA